MYTALYQAVSRDQAFFMLYFGCVGSLLCICALIWMIVSERSEKELEICLQKAKRGEERVDSIISIIKAVILVFIIVLIAAGSIKMAYEGMTMLVLINN